MSVQVIKTVEDFQAILLSAGSKLLVVDFTATWCGPCQRIKPTFHAMAAADADVIFAQVDVDENSETAEMCGVQSMPTFQFYKNGSKVQEFSGASEDMLKSAIAKHR